MTDKAGTFAACADSLAEMCAYYFIAAVLIMGRHGWSLHLGWILLCTAACTVFFGLFLKKPRAMPALVVSVLGLFAACMAIYLVMSTAGLSFGLVFVLAVGAGMTVGLPLYHTFKRPEMHGHLVHLDVLLMALTALLLIREAMNIDTVTAGLMLITLLLVTASAVGLRMSGSGDDTEVLRAGLVALGASGCTAGIVVAISALLSRSGGTTSAVLRGIGAFFSAIGRAIQNFFGWLTSFIHLNEEMDTVAVEDIPSIANAESEGSQMSLHVNGTAVTIIAVVIILVIAILVAVLLRRKKLSAPAVAAVSEGQAVVRSHTPMAQMWQRFLARLRFRRLSWINRNTPAGVLVRLERAARKQKEPRLSGESMRHFIERMDKDNGLDGLADELDRRYYGAGPGEMTAARCRKMREYIRKVM